MKINKLFEDVNDEVVEASATEADLINPNEPS